MSAAQLPPELDNLSKLATHKLGRNPISGTLPAMRKPKPDLIKSAPPRPHAFKPSASTVRSGCERFGPGLNRPG